MEYIASVAVSILMYAMLGLSLNLLLGYAGQMTMAQAAFYGVGAYAATLLVLPTVTFATGAHFITGAGWSHFPAIGAAILLAFALASVISFPAARRIRGEFLILMTMTFQVIFEDSMVAWSGFTGGAYGLGPVPGLEIFGTTLSSPSSFLPFVAPAAVVVFVVCLVIVTSPFGRVLKAIREDEGAVRALGKNTAMAKIIVFGISSAIAGGTGAIAAFYYGYIAPSSYTLDLSIFLIAIVVLGGSGSLVGTLVGAIVLGTLQPLLSAYLGSVDAVPWQAVIYGLALVVMMLIRPEGLVPEGATVRVFRRRRGSEPATASHPQILRAAPVAPAVDEAPVVRVDNLVKSFGGIRAVDGVCLDLRGGQITALIGPNGAGKTTLFNLITGEYRPDAGSVLLRGNDITGMPPDAVVRRGMIRSFQDVRVFHRMTAVENVALAVQGQLGENPLQLLYYPRVRRLDRATRQQSREYLHFVGADDLGDRIVGSLSYAEQKVVALARLVASDCEVMLLDEPTAGMDVSAVEQVIGLIERLSRELHRTICIVEHSLPVLARLADHAYFLEQGRVIGSGTVQSLTQQPELVEAYFGT